MASKHTFKKSVDIYERHNLLKDCWATHDGHVEEEGQDWTRQNPQEPKRRIGKDLHGYNGPNGGSGQSQSTLRNQGRPGQTKHPTDRCNQVCLILIRFETGGWCF